VVRRAVPVWLLAPALLAGVGAGLWVGLSLGGAQRPAWPGAGMGEVRSSGGLASGGGLATSPAVDQGPGGPAAARGREASAPACLALLERHLSEGADRLAVPAAEECLAGEPRLRERLMPLLVAAVVRLASRALETGRPAEALRWLGRGLDAVGDEGQLHLFTARAYRALQDDANARYHFERAARFAPTLLRPVADELRALTLRQVERLRAQGQAESALALLSEAAQRYPDEAAYQRALGELLIERGDLEGAAGAAERALALGGDPEAELVRRVRALQDERREQGATRVPVEAHGGVLSVAVWVNDGAKPYRFLVDTGASHTAIASQLASALGVRGLIGAAPVPVSTANGPATAVPAVLRSIALADLRVEDEPVLILEGLHGADGLIGFSFLRRFHVELRPEAGYLTLRPR